MPVFEEAAKRLKLNLQIIDEKILVSSRVVAEKFNKDHDKVCRDIRNLIKSQPTILATDFFIESEYVTNRGRKYKEYLLTKDGFILLAMGFTGKEFIRIKIEYIEEFNRMEKELIEKEKQILELKAEIKEKELNNIKAVTMIFTHKDKVNFTTTQLYPILDKLGVLNKNRHQIHRLIKQALIGKYENLHADKEFNAEEFINDYEKLAEKLKEEYTGYFIDDRQVNLFNMLIEREKEDAIYYKR